MGKMVMEIRKVLLEEEGFEKDRERIMVEKIRKKTERWRIVRIYAKKEGLKGILKDLERWAEEREERMKTIVRGDFNARMGREEGGVEEVGNGEGRRGRKKIKGWEIR